MRKHPDSPPKDPRAAACLGFVTAAIAGSFASVAWMYWKSLAEATSHVRSGGMAFSMNIPGLGLEFGAFAFGIMAFVTLGATWLWSPAMLRSWYSVGGILCLIPVFVLAAVRMGWFHL